MKKIMLLLALMLSMQAHAITDLTESTEKRFNEDMVSDKVLIIDFYLPWCAPCKVLHPLLEDVEKSLGNKVTVWSIDASKVSLPIQAVPTIVMMQHLKSLGKLVGISPNETSQSLKAKLEMMLIDAKPTK